MRGLMKGEISTAPMRSRFTLQTRLDYYDHAQLFSIVRRNCDLLKMAIDACKKQGKYIGICGQGPSDHPDLARWLMEQGIDSVSLNPDSVVETWMYLSEA